MSNDGCLNFIIHFLIHVLQAVLLKYKNTRMGSATYERLCLGQFIPNFEKACLWVDNYSYTICDMVWEY